MRLIDADAFEKWAWSNPDVVVDGDGYVLPYAASNFAEEHIIDAVPVTEAELKHLINDTIAYIWRLEDRGCDKPEFGYDSRKALLEKLKQFYKEHFPENGCCCGERKDGEG